LVLEFWSCPGWDLILRSRLSPSVHTHIIFLLFSYQVCVIVRDKPITRGLWREHIILYYAKYYFLVWYYYLIWNDNRPRREHNIIKYYINFLYRGKRHLSWRLISDANRRARILIGRALSVVINYRYRKQQ